MLICASCNLEKPESCYTKDKNRKTGFRKNCKTCRVEERKLWYISNKDKSSKRSAKYYQRNKTRIKAAVAKYQKNKRHNDVNYRILCNLRRRLLHAVKREDKSLRTQALLGCSVVELRANLESKFKQGMTWDNYGKWHIDHIIPCSSFDMGDVIQQQKCFHYSNLQPLWAIENLKKSAKVMEPTPTH